MRKETRTYADRRKYMVQAVSKRRKKIKAMAVAELGGKCLACGYGYYQGALEIHHLYPKEKNFGIGAKGYTRSWEKILKELDKCILLCANCHREVEAGVSNSLP